MFTMAASKKKATKAKASKAKKSVAKASKASSSTARKAPTVQIKAPNLKNFKWSNIKKGVQDFYVKHPKLVQNLAWILAGVVSLMLVDYAVQYVNNDMSVAVVNNSRISRKDYYARLEQSAGADIADELIREKLIRQAAKEEGITVTPDEINAEYDDAVALYGGEETFTQALELYGLTPESYKDTIEVELLASKIIVEDPTEEELQTFFTDYKDTYFTEQDNYEDNTEYVAKMYTRAKLTELFTTWVQAEMDNAVIQNNVESQPDYGFFRATRNIFTNLYNKIVEMSAGDTTEE